MYAVNCKVVRKEGAKPKAESYLVEAVSLTDVETKMTKEFKDMSMEISSCRILNLHDIFENGKGSFFIMKLTYEAETDGKAIKETFVQEATDINEAKEEFRKSISYGDITGMELSSYMAVIR